MIHNMQARREFSAAICSSAVMEPDIGGTSRRLSHNDTQAGDHAWLLWHGRHNEWIQFPELAARLGSVQIGQLLL